MINEPFSFGSLASGGAFAAVISPPPFPALRDDFFLGEVACEG